MRDEQTGRVRRQPEGTVLYQAVQAAWAAFASRVSAAGRAVPRFCEREFAGFLRCGILGYGFARVHCDDCGEDDVVAFSCKGRGFCPSCGAARMVDTAAWLCDAVIPEVPVRQWVLSLPYRVRALCAYDAAVCALVRSALVRAVSGLYERTAARVGVPRPRTGAVSFVQRFDSGLRLNVHFHVLWLDGAYGWEPGRGQPAFHALQELRDVDVQQLVQRIRDRVLRALRKVGKWVDADAAADGDDGVGDELLPGLAAAAVAGRAALGDRAGQRDGRVGRDGRWEPQAKGPLCASLDGFSLHAGTWVSAQARDRLEHLCRYAARPAVAESRLVELADGRIGYSLKKRWRDRTTAVVMTKEVLMERLCALVPPPRRHLVTFHEKDVKSSGSSSVAEGPAGNGKRRGVPERQGDPKVGFPRERDRWEAADDAGTQWPRHFMTRAMAISSSSSEIRDREEKTSSAVLPSALERCWGRWVCRLRCRSRRGAGRRRRGTGSAPPVRASRSDCGVGALTLGGSWRGSGVLGGRETGGITAETGYAGYVDRLDEGVRRRQDGGWGVRVVRDRCLIRLCPRPISASSVAGSRLCECWMGSQHR